MTNDSNRFPGEGWTASDIVILVIFAACILMWAAGWLPEG